MFLTHSNSVYSENITLLDHISYPQYVHQIADGGGFTVQEGIRLMPGELINYVLNAKHGADKGTYDFIRSLFDIPSYKIGFILAAGGNSWTGYECNIVTTDRYPVYKIPPMGLSQIYAGYAANKIGDFDYIATDSTSCISGHSAWYTARNMLLLNQLDAVVIVAADNGISEDYLAIFGQHKLSRLKTEEGDDSVNKFRLGQACNISVFEDRPLHNPVIAHIEDIRIAAEKHTNPLGISSNGEGYRKVMGEYNLDFIKTHSTFSLDNEIEDKLIKEIYGNVRTINYKLRIGHTMGSSTAVETALAIKENSGTFLSLGAGMGNVFSSALVRII